RGADRPACGAWSVRARARRVPVDRARQDEQGDSRPARDLGPHRAQPCGAHLRQARRAQPLRRRDLAHGARPGGLTQNLMNWIPRWMALLLPFGPVGFMAWE